MSAGGAALAASRHLFPVDSIEGVVRLVGAQLAAGEPDLALCSIVVGAVENELTSRGPAAAAAAPTGAAATFPRLEYEAVAALHERFRALVAGAVPAGTVSSGAPTSGAGPTRRELVKRVSDCVWNSLTRSYYKDRAHLQSVYSLLAGKKLDCFGVALAVTAGCQALGCRDVHLALSEDHAWVVFGEDGRDTAEVTWHGKGNEDKRGQPIGTSDSSWLYVAGHPVICTREMELAALISSINPTLTATTDAHEVALMQQRLLWLLYDLGHLDAYPMALGNLGDLQEYNKLSDGKVRPDCTQLYAEAISSARKHYANRHVYPYTFQGGYYHRHKMYKEAFESWANAGEVIRQYNYSRDDEEIYKEFAEIANELIPQLMKAESSGHSARSILKDPECFASLLRFYDGICKWEEGSQTPILHIGWAKPLVNTISKFEAEVRAQVNILCSDDSEETTNGKERPTKTEVEKKTEGSEIKVSAIKTEETADQKNESKEISNNNSETAESANKKKEHPEETGEAESEISVHDQMEAVINSHPTITLHSHKMKGLKNLLLAEKLNTHAISLHLTAQSQVQISKRMRGEAGDGSAQCGARPKRARREH